MNKILSTVAISIIGCATTLFAQVSNDNEEGVVKINPRERAYRENQILVKFREGSPVQMRKAGKRMAATLSAVDALFAELGIKSAEQLMPQTGGVMKAQCAR